MNSRQREQAPMSVSDLLRFYMQPAVVAMAEKVERDLLLLTRKPLSESDSTIREAV